MYLLFVYVIASDLQKRVEGIPVPETGMRSVQNHTQNPVLRWKQSPALKPGTMPPVLGSYKGTVAPSTYAAYPPKPGLEVIFLPVLTSLDSS